MNEQINTGSPMMTMRETYGIRREDMKMNRDNQTKKSHMRLTKSIVLLASLVMIIGAVAGGTIAFMVANGGFKENTFKPSNVVVEVNETFIGNIKNNISVSNVGDTDAWIRAEVVINWQNASGEVYGQTPISDTDYIITFPEQSDWVQGADGFWYYTKPVKAETGETGILMTKIEEVASSANSKEAENAKYSLNVEILASGIQSVPTDVVVSEWSSGVSAVQNNQLVIKQSGGGN